MLSLQHEAVYPVPSASTEQLAISINIPSRTIIGLAKAFIPIAISLFAQQQGSQR